MHRKKTNNEIKKLNQSYNERKILSDQFTPIVFDPKLTSNPFLRDQEKFHYLVHRIKEYNKQVLNAGVQDSYQMMVYAKLFSLISTIGNMDTREDQISRLDELYNWLIKQDNMITQRKDQGGVRYKILSHEQAENSSPPPSIKKKRFSMDPNPKDVLPSDYRQKQSLPFELNWRTAHKELETSDKRILEYKRKMLNLMPLEIPKEEEKKQPRVIFPNMGRYNWVKEFQLQQNVEGDHAAVENPENAISNPQKLTQEQKKPEQATIVENQQPGQDLGLGEEPGDEEPEEPEQQQQLDKLAPRLKSYIHEGRKVQKGEKLRQNRMNERYLKIQHNFIQKQNQDAGFVHIMDQWGARKSKIQKDIIKRIQQQGISPRYSLSMEAPPEEEKMNSQDQIKFGLSKTLPLHQMKPVLDMSTDFALPKIGQKKKIYEKTIRKDRLDNLKKKFGGMLNLKSDQQKINQPESLCNCSPKRFGFSQILQRHSRQKQRLIQLDEITSIKQKLARSKVNIDVRTLAMSMCSPEDEENLPENSFPMKDLPANPFWVEPAKKKKKKK